VSLRNWLTAEVIPPQRDDPPVLRWHAGCFLTLAVVIVLSFVMTAIQGCQRGPHWRHYCVHSETAVGVAVTTHGAVPTITQICLQRDSVWVNGSYED